MDIEYTREFDAPVEDVVALMQSEPLQRGKADGLGAVDFSYESTGGETPTVVSRRRIPTGGMPEFVKAMVTPTMTVVETEVWEPADAGVRRASFDIDVSGAPVEHRGTVEVVPTEAGCRLTFAGQWRATVPLFRSNVEEASLGSLRDTIETEFALIADRLPSRAR